MTMTNEQIDAEFARIKSSFIAKGRLEYGLLDTLATALKSAIQDSARIEWLVSQKRLDCPWQGENSIVFNWPDGTAIREAIDARRKGEGCGSRENGSREARSEPVLRKSRTTERLEFLEELNRPKKARKAR